MHSRTGERGFQTNDGAATEGENDRYGHRNNGTKWQCHSLRSLLVLILYSDPGMLTSQDPVMCTVTLDVLINNHEGRIPSPELIGNQTQPAIRDFLHA